MRRLIRVDIGLVLKLQIEESTLTILPRGGRDWLEFMVCLFVDKAIWRALQF